MLYFINVFSANISYASLSPQNKASNTKQSKLKVISGKMFSYGKPALKISMLNHELIFSRA